MKEYWPSRYLSFFFFCKCILIVCSQSRRGQENRRFKCQERSTSGRDYVGEANTTVDGIPCQMWSDTNPHDHDFTHVGDHNFCRNPIGASDSQLWCYTNDPEHERQNCSVPFCPPLRALDFSLDSDSKPDESNSYTHASLYKENLPSSFTICTSLMVEAWNKYVSAKVFFLHDNKGEGWHTLGIAAEATYTEFSLQFEDSPALSNQSKILFFPLQWTRVCLSVDAYTFLTRLVVDGELLVENEVKLKNEPDNLNLVLGSWTSPTSGNTYEYP